MEGAHKRPLPKVISGSARKAGHSTSTPHKRLTPQGAGYKGSDLSRAGLIGMRRHNTRQQTHSHNRHQTFLLETIEPCALLFYCFNEKIYKENISNSIFQSRKYGCENPGQADVLNQCKSVTCH